MSAGPKHEIVIIRRGGHGDHDDHHGGVWKIAFADFMTAMMAFFLVMWLISANDKTRASVARYFNPVKLVDATTQPRGLNDPKKDDSGITASPDTKDTKGSSRDMAKDNADKKPQGPTPNETPQSREKRLDTAMRDNPLAALAEIAAGQGAAQDLPKTGERTSHPVIGRKGGSAFRDPFAPPPPPSRSDAAAEDVDARNGPTKDDPAKAEPVKQALSQVPLAAAEAKDSKVKTPALESKSAELVKQLTASLKTTGREGSGPDIAVRPTKQGVLVSLTDTGNFSMFANGSAVPTRRVVLMMERLAKVLASKPGSVVIRGFTDNKRFRTGRYDNWSLSVDRAQAAHYMLVRGGLSDERIASVEGFADRVSQAGIDPSSALNRRIEILVRDKAE